jgi:integrase
MPFPCGLGVVSGRRVASCSSTPDVAKNVMARACKAAAIADYHPHDLGDRYASLKLREGVPVTDVAAQLGHSKKSMTLDT